MATYVENVVLTSRERDAAWKSLSDEETRVMTYFLAEEFPAVFDTLHERVPSGRLYIASTPEPKKASA